MSTAEDSERDPPFYLHRAASIRGQASLWRPTRKWPNGNCSMTPRVEKTTEFITLVLFENDCVGNMQTSSLYRFSWSNWKIAATRRKCCCAFSGSSELRYLASKGRVSRIAIRFRDAPRECETCSNHLAPSATRLLLHSAAR